MWSDASTTVHHGTWQMFLEVGRAVTNWRCRPVDTASTLPVKNSCQTALRTGHSASLTDDGATRGLVFVAFHSLYPRHPAKSLSLPLTEGCRYKRMITEMTTYRLPFALVEGQRDTLSVESSSTAAQLHEKSHLTIGEWP